MDQEMRPRGFLLVSVLLITTLLLTLGLTFLGKRAIQYRRAAMYESAARARALAESGLEDALCKLRRDIEFPPLSKDQNVFSYVEEVEVAGDRIGAYRVTLDGSKRYAPYGVWLITSQGEAGGTPANPASVRTFRAEVDVYRLDRIDKTLNNAYYYDVINFQDMGGL
jgi:Tfp pilus assembly protein PilX